MRSLNGYQGDEIHIDYPTIPGATVSELEHTIMAEFGNGLRAVDVLLVAGLNEILRGATDHEILEDIQQFSDCLSNLCQAWRYVFKALLSSLKIFKGTDRLCKAVKLIMQCCGQIF